MRSKSATAPSRVSKLHIPQHGRDWTRVAISPTRPGRWQVRRLIRSLHRFTAPVPPFARQGPSGRFPRVTARTAALRLLAVPRPLCSPLCGRVPAFAEDVEISQVPQATPAHVPRRKPPVGTTARGSGPAALRWRNRQRPSAQPRARRLPQPRSISGYQRGPRARCLRFAAGVAPAPRKTRFPPASLLQSVGLPPAGRFAEFRSAT